MLSLNPDEIVLANTGDGTLFVEALEIDRQGGKATTTRIIGKQIASSHILEYSFPKEDGSDKNTYKRVTVRGSSSLDNEMQAEIARQVSEDGKCYQLSFYEADNPQYLQVKDWYSRHGTLGPMTIPHEAVIHAYSMKTKKNFSSPFPIVAMVFHIQSPECESPTK